MMHSRPIGAALLLFALAGAAQAQQSIVYPAQGQSADQQAKDQAECNAWATQSTGIDPVAVAQQASQPPPPAQPTGQRVRGAARGALAGAAIGGIAGDTSQGAGIGAVVGTVAGGRRARQQQADQQNAYAAQQQQTLATYQRAVAACMEGRHYVTK